MKFFKILMKVVTKRVKVKPELDGDLGSVNTR